MHFVIRTRDIDMKTKNELLKERLKFIAEIAHEIRIPLAGIISFRNFYSPQIWIEEKLLSIPII